MRSGSVRRAGLRARVLAGVLGKVARDVTLLAPPELGEAWKEGGATVGGSSAMTPKRNPAAVVSVLACTTRVPGLVATMEQEHQRAAGAWQVEWGTLTGLLGLTASAAACARELLASLHVDPDRMGENVRRQAGARVPEAADPAHHLGEARAIERALTECEL